MVGYTWSDAFLLTPEDTGGDGVPDVWNRDNNADGKNDLMIALGHLPGRGHIVALGINESTQIVGYGCTDLWGHSWEDRAFLWEDNQLLDLNNLVRADSGWSLRRANDINDHGDIMGYGVSPNGETHAFLLTPVPEPATWALLSLGAVALMRRRRRR